MKKLVVLLGIFTSLSSFASLPEQISCQNDRGLVMKITLTPTEATAPIYEVKLSYKGEQSENFNAYLKKNSDSSFMIEGRVGNLVISAGLSFGDKIEGFYQEAANNGMSPLPATLFKNCTIK